MADEILKHLRQLDENLQSQNSITVEEIKICANLNPYKDWIAEVIGDASCLKEVIENELVKEIDRFELV